MSGASYLAGAAEPPRGAALSTPRPAAAASPGHAWDGSGDTRGPRRAAPPAARKARSTGPRPDSCSGEAAAAGNTKRLIQPR